MHLQPLYSEILLCLWIHTLRFSHHRGKNRLCVRHVHRVILPLLLPYKLVFSNLSSELSASAFFGFLLHWKIKYSSYQVKLFFLKIRENKWGSMDVSVD